MLIDKTVKVPKSARTKANSNDLIYFKNGQKERVTLSNRQVKVLEYAWKKLRLYCVSKRYSYTESAKSFILNGSNEVLEAGEKKLTFEMLEVNLTLFVLCTECDSNRPGSERLGKDCTVSKSYFFAGTHRPWKRFSFNNKRNTHR